MGGGRGGQALLLGTWGHWVVFPAPQLHPYRSPSSEDESSDEFPSGLGLGGSNKTRGRGLQERKPRARGVELRLPPGTAEGGGTHEKRGWPRVQLPEGWEPAWAATRPEKCCETSETRSASPCCLPCPSPLLGAEQQPREVSQEDLRLRVGAAGPAHAVGCSWQEDVNPWA